MVKRLDLDRLYREQNRFAEERDWTQFHTPKNLAMALSVEAGELCEIFQWLNDKQVATIQNDEAKMDSIKDELADVFFYTTRLASVLNVDLEEAYWRKMKKNAVKYPVHLAKGNAKKYTEL